MNFDWSPEQETLFSRTLAFARTRLNPSALATSAAQARSAPDGARALDGNDGAGPFSYAAWTLLGRFGLLGIASPQRYGGTNLDALTMARVVEALGQGCEDMGVVFAACAHLFACVAPIVEHGSDELRSHVLPRLTSGEWIGANAITEASSGSDVSNLKTLAEQDGDHYILSGTKTYVTNGPVADVFLVYATQNPAHGFLGISAFIVERETPGLTVGPALCTVGLHSAPIAQVYLQDCRIPARNRLGSEGRGSAIFASSMLIERSCLFAMYVGAMQRLLDRVIDHATEKRLVGQRFQAMRHRIVDMKLQIEAARLLLYRACWEIDRGLPATMNVALAKLAVSETVIRASLDSFELLGAAAYLCENGFEEGLRDALPGAIFSGTSAIQRELIARELGL